MNERTAERTPWWSSIVTRITLGVAVLVAASALMSGWLVYRGGRDQVVRSARVDMAHARERAAERISIFTGTLKEDIGFLADNSPLRELALAVDSGDTVLIAAAKERLALLMGSFIRSRPQYAQLRWIDADSLGMERIRFDRQGSLIIHVPDSALQAKGDRDYYREAVELAPGAHYFSAIDLNKEHGRVEVPWVPTLRAAAPVRTPEGRPMGIVVINADLRPLFSEIAALDEHATLILADDDGDVLLHPDTAVMFRFDFADRHQLTDAVPELAAQAGVEGEVPDRLVEHARFEPRGLGRPLEIVLLRDTHALLAAMRRERDRNLLLAGAVGLCFVLVTALFAGGIARGLGRLTRRVERFAAGRSGEELPVRRRDEIGRLARSLEHMQQRISQRVEGIDRARVEAEMSDRQRRDFLANMSHEVRTPLNTIIGLSGEVNTGALDDGDRERLALVQRSAQRLKRLVDDLLLGARIGEGRLELRPSATDVRQLLSDLLQSHRRAAEEKGLALRMRGGQLPERLWIDGLRLHQVIDNLVGNAVRFTSDGHVDVEANLDAEGFLHVIVTDTGPGLSPQERERVFERFERGVAAESSDGAGLGLAITRRLVELMGGTLRLDTEKGRGACFHVALPTSAPREAPAEQPAPDPAALSGLRVLYVEDVESNRMVMEQWASKWGWKLTLAASPEEAIKTCEAADFDALLLDVDLGEGMRGTQLGMRLRGLKRLRYAPMLAVTAYTGEDQEEEILKAGLNDRVTKPIDRQELFDRLVYWCGAGAAIAGAPDLSALEAQYDGDPEKVLTVLQQYRRELTQWRIALRKAAMAKDAAAIRAVLHKVRPHAQLLGVAAEFNFPSGDEQAGDADAALGNWMEAFRACDRVLLRRQRELQAVTAGRAS